MAESTEPNTELPPVTPQAEQQAAQERAKACELAVVELIKQYNCTPVFAQKTLDGQLHILQGVPLELLFVPNELLKQS